MVQEGYWGSRQDLAYYRLVRAWLDELGPGRLIIDVGGADTPVVTWGRFERRIVIDPGGASPLEGVESHAESWLSYHPDERADVITCLQVLEHLDDEQVAAFARKLLSSGRTAIISVPYLWPAGSCEHHRQDPVTLTKLAGWVGQRPRRSVVVTDGKWRRLVTLFGVGD